jgi:pimeloyl-ACP methyl ester carboxylesterase
MRFRESRGRCSIGALLRATSVLYFLFHQLTFKPTALAAHLNTQGARLPRRGDNNSWAISTQLEKFLMRLATVLCLFPVLALGDSLPFSISDGLGLSPPFIQLAGAAPQSSSSAAPPALAASGRGFADKLKPCHVTGLDEEVLCGRYEVYENRMGLTRRKIGLKIVVLPARGTEIAADPLVFLAGGGVAPATGYASFLSKAFPSLRLQRDILLVDQRGTGGSNPLECDLSTDVTNAEYRDAARFVASVRRCRDALKQKADLRYYTTPIAMDDLDEIREWLGYPRIDIFGVSYGTTAALVYVRQHPEHIRVVALQGVLPIDVPMWLEYPRSAENALARVFAACAQQPACHAAFPKLENEFRILLKRLADRPAMLKVSPLETGPAVEVMIDDQVLRDFVSKVLYSASRIHDLPLLLHLAYQGDYQLLAMRVASNEPSNIPKGIYLSIVCSENMHFDPAALASATADTFMGDLRVGRDVRACREWPRGWLPQGFWTPVTSDVPALVLNGSLDDVTPPRYGERVAQSLSNSRHLVLPNRGHNDTDPCVCGIIENFIAAGRIEGLDSSCLEKSDDLTFALQRDQLLD